MRWNLRKDRNELREWILVMTGSRAFPSEGRGELNLWYGNMLAELKKKQEAQCARRQQARSGQERSMGPDWTLGFILSVWETTQVSWEQISSGGGWRVGMHEVLPFHLTDAMLLLSHYPIHGLLHSSLPPVLTTQRFLPSPQLRPSFMWFFLPGCSLTTFLKVDS